MTPHKHKDLIIAFANGAEIEGYSKHLNEWLTIDYPSWHESVQYRIKPQKKLIPFDFSDAEKIIGKCVKHKEGLSCVAVLTECNLTDVRIGNDFERYEILLQDYTFLDGSPCGKVAE